MIGKNLIYFSTIFLLAIGCQRKDPVSVSRFDAQEVILLDDWDALSLSEDPASIHSAIVEDDHLKLTVSYSGGDKKHDFQLFGGKTFLESYPVQYKLFLAHDANGDRAEALIKEELVFDLAPLKALYKSIYRDNGPILLRVYAPGEEDTFKALIVYEF